MSFELIREDIVGVVVTPTCAKKLFKLLGSAPANIDEAIDAASASIDDPKPIGEYMGTIIWLAPTKKPEEIDNEP